MLSNKTYSEKNDALLLAHAAALLVLCFLWQCRAYLK